MILSPPQYHMAKIPLGRVGPRARRSRTKWFVGLAVLAVAGVVGGGCSSVEHRQEEAEKVYEPEPKGWWGEFWSNVRRALHPGP